MPSAAGDLEPVMQSHVPAEDSRAVVFATTVDGIKLPVIDVTHPAFAIPDDPASFAARRDAFLAWDRRNRRMPTMVTRALMRLAARRSRLLRKILASDNEYLDSITTYMVKLGAHHLPPGFDSSVDRKVATAPHMALVRLRMQQIARLLADALLAPLTDAPDAPLHLVNIAGGPALDSINALIILARARDADPASDRNPRLRCAAGRADLRRARSACAYRAPWAAAWARDPIPAPRLRLERHRAAGAPACRPRGV